MTSLLEVAACLGIDLSGLLNQIVAESLPAYLERASQVMERRQKARAALSQVALNADHPRVLELIRVAESVPDPERLPQMIQVALESRNRGDPPVEEIVQAALKQVHER